MKAMYHVPSPGDIHTSRDNGTARFISHVTDIPADTQFIWVINGTVVTTSPEGKYFSDGRESCWDIIDLKLIRPGISIFGEHMSTEEMIGFIKSSLEFVHSYEDAKNRQLLAVFLGYQVSCWTDTHGTNSGNNSACDIVEALGLSNVKTCSERTTHEWTVALDLLRNA